MHRSFTKIRITEPRQNDECSTQMREKAHENIISKIIMLKTEIEEIDIYIATLISARNVKKIKDHF